MNRYISDDLFRVALGTNSAQLIGQHMLDSFYQSIEAAAAKSASMSLLKALGPEPNFLGNNYTKLMAASAIGVDQLLMKSVADKARDPLGAAALGIKSTGSVIPQAADAMKSWARSDKLIGAATGSLASNAEWALSGRSIQDMAMGHMEKHFAGLQESVRSIFDKAIKQQSMPSLRAIFFPANLVELDSEYTLEDVLEFVQAHGVPLMYVPRARIAARLLRAENKQAVRDILGHEFNNIVDDCEAVMEGISWDGLFEYREFVDDAINSIRAGQTKSAQAMLTVLLDTMSYQQNPFGDSKKYQLGITSYQPDREKNQVELEDELTMRASLVWFPIRNVHFRFDRKLEDKIPHDYGRHPSTHAVSKKQYSKRNCVQALMVVSSLLAHVDDSHRRRTRLLEGTGRGLDPAP